MAHVPRHHSSTACGDAISRVRFDMCEGWSWHSLSSEEIKWSWPGLALRRKQETSTYYPRGYCFFRFCFAHNLWLNLRTELVVVRQQEGRKLDFLCLVTLSTTRCRCTYSYFTKVSLTHDSSSNTMALFSTIHRRASGSVFCRDPVTPGPFIKEVCTV